MFRRLRSARRFGSADPFSSLGPNTGTLNVAGAVSIPAYAQRAGLQITADAAGTGTVYGLCGSGVASAANHHFSFGPGGSWDGQATQSVYSGRVSLFCAGAILVGVLEA